MQAQDFFAVFDRSVAWGIYLGAAALLLGVLFWVTHRWQRNLRWLLLGLLALAALMPASVPGHAALAPAFMVVGLAMLAGSIDIVAPVAVRFLLSGLLVLILVIVEGVWWRRRQRQQTPVRRGARQAPAKR